MSFTVIRLLPALLLGLILSAQPALIYAGEPRKTEKAHRSFNGTAASIELFSPRVRHSTITYLRLRMLELREQDLERARAVIERRLNIEDLLNDRPVPKRKSTP